MNTPKQAPGPWRVEAAPTSYEIVAADDSLLAETWDADVAGSMAASLEMLDALKDVVARFAGDDALALAVLLGALLGMAFRSFMHWELRDLRPLESAHEARRR